ncbi:Transcription elongation factor, GreA/GreB, C-term [Prosthecobacter debontii]|uniref:Transcription elongation factor, GreA/GreB, C-term n=1 Tax=Prosthecobacter debontii TaxID=48467 RepID=A0A1T4WM49_9BACT|nr:GreA/GreB family elongation factor [Prosthecobacter debontii]SKA77955.1 Transcription elongation factor, GreA/GreB, C-term [Prosthecobacter debontii]
MNKILYYDRVHLRALQEAELPVDERELIIQIVPNYEADVLSGRISADAPLAKAVLHRRQGDVVTVRTRDQSIPMRILDVEKSRAAG